MLSFFGKKKISTETVSKQFVAHLLEATEKGFPELAELINIDQAFEQSPNVSHENSSPFLTIVLAANFKLLPTYFSDNKDEKISTSALSYLAETLDNQTISQDIKDMQKLMSRVNHPSKNTLYAMSKALFEVYNLNDFQKSYFKNLHTPDPTFLKRMDEVMPHFIWNWDDLLKQYRLV